MMDLISLYYFSELSEDLNMTQTAKRLFISQQTLSNHIQRLEENYGAQLLYRKPSLSLTYAGEQVLAFANEVRKEQISLKEILNDIEHQECGVLRFGASTMRMNLCLPNILPEFSARYPNVEIRITDTISSKLEPMVMDGELDFALVLSREANSYVIERHLMDDQIYLCVSNSLLERYYDQKYIKELKEKSMHGAYVQDFKRLPFCMLVNRIGRHIQKCFDEAGFNPKVYMSSTYTEISTNICFNSLACCFGTQMSLAAKRGQIPDDINIFPLFYKKAPMIQKFSLIWRRDRYLSRFLQHFQELLLRWATEIEEVQIERTA